MASARISRGFGTFRDEREQPVAAEGRERTPDLGLENHHQGENEEGREIMKKPADDAQLEHLRQEHDGDEEDRERGEHSRAARPTKKQPGEIDADRQKGDLECVAPMRGGELRKVRDVHALRMASVIRSASTLGRTSCTRKMAAPRLRA